MMAYGTSRASRACKVDHLVVQLSGSALGRAVDRAGVGRSGSRTGVEAGLDVLAQVQHVDVREVRWQAVGCPFLPLYSFSTENTFAFWPLATATALR